ncbi:MAG: multiheme c-type cytochrome [Deferrisomatales bacterium]|nr:multiheme c-type cytochrome [Deferrisomatales bacterium]
MRYLGLVAVLALLLPAPAAATQDAEIDYSKLRIDTEGFNPASRCGECHIDIYNHWRESMHAKAMTDPAFLAAFRAERIQSDPALRAQCLSCHAPTLHYDPRLSLSDEVVQEGVGCDFCHSVQGLDPTNPERPFQVEWGKLKRGPLKDTESPVHETRHLELFTKADFCGVCHEMSNANGLPIITTYSEWKEGYFGKEGTAQCQECHMPLAAGFTVSEQHRKTKRRINLHSFPGGHSRSQLLDALSLEILEESKLYGIMRVKLGLTNRGAGHSVPTGNPLRRVIVDFSAYSALNQLIYNEQVDISRRYADDEGTELLTDEGVLLDATQVLKDNRIAPGETRELVFEFAAPHERLLVDTKVIYVYDNPAFPDLAREEKLISFTRVVNRAAGRAGGPGE